MAIRFNALRLTRGIKEWRIEYYRPTLQDDNEQDWHIITDSNFGFPHSVQVERYMFRKTNPKFLLMPRLADRSVVIKPVDQSTFQRVNVGHYILVPPMDCRFS